MNNRIEFAHSLRGFAAISVIISHILGGFWVHTASVVNILKFPSYDVEVPKYISQLHFENFFNYGSFGVAVFFLISGFVIPFSLGKLSRMEFAVGRLLRILPVYVVSLLLSLIALYSVGNVIFPDYEFPYSHGDIAIQAFLLRGWLWISSMDGVSWTLEIEMVFYLLSALIIPFILKTRRFYSLDIVVVFLTVLCMVIAEVVFDLKAGLHTGLLFLTYSIPFVIFMLIGTQFHFYLNNYINSGQFTVSVLLYCWCFALACNSHVSLKAMPLFSYFLAMGVFWGFFLVRDNVKGSSVVNWLADISYPLYAVHALLGYSIMYYFNHLGWSPLLIIVVSLVVIFLMAYLIHITVEKHSIKTGKRLIKWLQKSRAQNGDNDDNCSAQTKAA